MQSDKDMKIYRFILNGSPIFKPVVELKVEGYTFLCNYSNIFIISEKYPSIQSSDSLEDLVSFYDPFRNVAIYFLKDYPKVSIFLKRMISRLITQNKSKSDQEIILGHLSELQRLYEEIARQSILYILSYQDRKLLITEDLLLE